MKSIFKLTTVLLLISTVLASASGNDYTKQYKKGWLKNSVSGIHISNKFGEVKINNSGGDSITIKVLITIESASEKKASEIMNKIHISLQKDGDMVIGTTDIDDGFKGNNSFSIDYLINTPKNKNLFITNKYGNVVMDDLDANGSFEISYGSMTAGNLHTPAGSPIKILIAYGKATLETINNADLEINYSKLFADEIGNLEIQSKYSTINLHKSSKISIESKYDGFNIDEVGSLKSESKYTNYKIGQLNGDFDLDTGYGSVRISKVDAKFDKIRIVNSYGGIYIGLNELDYKLKADCDYCDVNYPANRFKGNRIKENHSLSLDGNVGNGRGSVSITSRYGGVKLTE